MLRLRFCVRGFSSCGKRGPLFIAVHGPLTIAASLVVGHRLQTRSSVAVAHGPSCSMACGILPDQGSNPCPLHWQADSQPLRHQGSPLCLFLICFPFPPQLSQTSFFIIRFTEWDGNIVGMFNGQNVFPSFLKIFSNI